MTTGITDTAAGGVADETDDAGLDLLDVTEAMGTHFHEHHDTILRWSWKLFCAKWARMVVQLATRKREQDARDEQREHDQRLGELRAQVNQA